MSAALTVAFASPSLAAFWVSEDGTVLTGDSALTTYKGQDFDGKEFADYKEVHATVIGKEQEKDYSTYHTWSGRISASDTDFYLTVISEDTFGNDDAIKLDNHGPYVEARDLYLDVTGYKSDGINITWDTTFPGIKPHVKARNTYVTVNSVDGNGFGIRVNSSKGFTTEDNESYVTIEENAEVNMSKGGTGLFAGIPKTWAYYSDSLNPGETLKILKWTFYGTGMRAVINVNGTTSVTLGKDGFVGTNSTFADAGVYARYHGVINLNNLTIDSYGSGNNERSRDVHGILVGERSKNENKLDYRPEVNVTGDTLIHMYRGEKGTGNIYALKAIEGDINIDQDKDASLVQITGDVYNEDGIIQANFRKGGSFLIGASTLSEQEGKNPRTDFLFAADSTWTVTGDSSVSTLTLDGGTVQFDIPQEVPDEGDGGTQNFLQLNENPDNSPEPIAYRTLQAKALKGSGGTFIMRADLSQTDSSILSSDRIVAGDVTGTHVGKVLFTGFPGSADQIASSSWLISQDTGTMTITDPEGGNQFTANGAMSWWGFKFVQDGTDISNFTQEDWDALSNAGTGAGNWYLAQTRSEKLPPEAEQIENLGSSVAQAIGWLSEKNDLRRRLGEIRYGSQTGVWAKVFHRQDRASGFRYNGFEQKSTGVHFGYDTFVNRSGNADWIVGATFRYARSEQEGIETAFAGDGTTDEYSAKIYATWLHDAGWYVDMLAQVGYYDQEIDGVNNQGDAAFDASYHNVGKGVSVEVGKMIALTGETSMREARNHWFIEPELELSYFHISGDDFKTLTGLQVDQGNADFLTGRAGFVLGKKFSYGTTSDDPRWFQLGLIGGVTHEFLGEQTIRFTGTDGRSVSVEGNGLGGTSYYYGFTADWQVSDRIRFYGELDREEGDNYTKDFGINIGFKYAF